MTDDFPPADAVTALKQTYTAFAAAVRTMDDERSWQPTECTGWAVRDLVFHCLCDAQRGLVALHSPAVAPPDRDACTYWADWAPAAASSDGTSDTAPAATSAATAGAAAGRRFARVVAGMFLDAAQLRDLYLETAAAVVDAATSTDPARIVTTQNHTLTAADLMRTLTVEATIHHLDLAPALSASTAPAPAGLAETRRTLDGLLGHPVPILDWDDATYAGKATGRRRLTGQERAGLRSDAARFPLFC